jgi:hypothetical protein
MDAAARRKTYEIPKSDSVGLAEWTSKIKALQRQVDEDEEAETRRLEEEIMVSRMSRMRRSTLQSRPLSHDPCESPLEPDNYFEIHLVPQSKLSTNSRGLHHLHPMLTIPSLPKTSSGIERLRCANSWVNGVLSLLIFPVRKPRQTTRYPPHPNRRFLLTTHDKDKCR